MEALAVTVPTRERPEHLRRCLEALAAAREQIDFTVYVCDSTTALGRRAAVASVCGEFDFVELYLHNGKTRAEARNVCLEVAREHLMVTVDDDVYVEPDAIRLMAEAYERGSGPRVVSGAMRIGDEESCPRVIRRIGYGRAALPGEEPDFVLTGLLLFTRELASTWEWNERMPVQEDRFMCALWRRHGVQMLHEPAAGAVHDGIPHRTCQHQATHIYVNLFDRLVANRRLRRAFAYELFGFAAGVKSYCRSLRGTRQFLAAWWGGHRAFWRDRRELRELCRLEPGVGAPLLEAPAPPAPLVLFEAEQLAE